MLRINLSPAQLCKMLVNVRTVMCSMCTVAARWPLDSDLGSPQHSYITILADICTHDISPDKGWGTVDCLIWFKDQEEKEPKVHGECSALRANWHEQELPPQALDFTSWMHKRAVRQQLGFFPFFLPKPLIQISSTVTPLTSSHCTAQTHDLDLQ